LGGDVVAVRALTSAQKRQKETTVNIAYNAIMGGTLEASVVDKVEPKVEVKRSNQA
jgi:hypothetical protein